MDALRLSTTWQDGVATVTVTGELDIATTGRLRAHVAQTLANGCGSQLILEVSGVSFIGADGLSALVALQRLAHRRHTALHLTGLTPAFLRLLKITRLEGHLTRVEP
ncbi:STAS domain-containing protein [Nonomuraea basaltis]|uniref:STAS domain-containing protein n=1 Tax=Nonomuraea basaltis TaxID=2495887 RepID=UPI00110C4825|nr:STAS domain-containing protein [Nonomuraea basaltis]TMR88979.1 STAS domain-containing protein [Nonomuraea basaltis]